VVAHDALAERFQHHDALAPGHHDAGDADHLFLAHGVADDGERLLADLISRRQVAIAVATKSTILDPAAAPLGTDDDAAGRPPTAAEVEFAYSHKVGSGVSSERSATSSAAGPSQTRKARRTGAYHGEILEMRSGAVFIWRGRPIISISVRRAFSCLLNGSRVA
jgi:hypothetical protein